MADAFEVVEGVGGGGVWAERLPIKKKQDRTPTEDCAAIFLRVIGYRSMVSLLKLPRRWNYGVE